MTTPRRRGRAWPAAVLLPFLLAVCDDGTGPEPDPDPDPEPEPFAATLVVEGLPAEAGAGNLLAVTVRVHDQNDDAFANQLVEFTPLDGGLLSAASATTDSAGIAQVTWTLPVAAGAKRLRVRADTLEQDVTVQSRMGVAADIRMIAMPPADAPAGSIVGPIVVRAVDALNAPAPGVLIEWIVASGGGELLNATTRTDLAGDVSTEWRLGSESVQQLTVRVQFGGTTITLTFGTQAFEGPRIDTDLVAVPRVGRGYSARLHARGGVEPYTLSLASGTLPPGLGFDGDAIVGTPTAAGEYAFTLALTDALGASDTRAYTLRVCGPALALAPGESAFVVFPDLCGVVLPSGGDATYRLGVMATGEHFYGPQPIEGDLLVRTTREGSGPIVQPVRMHTNAAPPAAAAAAADAEPSDLAHIEWSTREYAHAAGAYDVRPGRTAVAASDPAPTRTFRFGVPSTGEVVTVNATLRWTSASVAYYVDDEAITNGGTDWPDSRFEQELAVFEAHGRPILENVFGGWAPPGVTTSFTDDAGAPLELPTTDLDLNGHIVALQLRPQYMSGFSGWVTPCDRMPRPEHANGDVPSCESSNEGEIMYVLGPGRSLLVHEAKHITSHGYAVFGNRGFNPSWIEEGTALNASEKTSRSVSGIPVSRRVVASDIFVDAGKESSDTQNMRAATALARVFLAAAPIASVLGNPSPNPGGSNYYASSWFFHRFLEDAYGDGTGAEPFRTLNTTVSGPEGIEAVTGTSMRDLFAEFMLAIAVDDVPVARAATERVFSGYDFADIAQGEPEPELQLGTWPIVESAVAFGAYEWLLDAWTTAPTFFELSADSGEALRIDVMRGDGSALNPEIDVIGVVVRTE